jgi:hypothetical protein
VSDGSQTEAGSLAGGADPPPFGERRSWVLQAGDITTGIPVSEQGEQVSLNMGESK